MTRAGGTDNLTISSGGQSWLVLQNHLDAYLAARDRQGQPPCLGEFLPDQPAGLRRLVLVELIKVDLQYRWRTLGEHRRIEAYLHDYPELAGDLVPCDLIYEEFHIRRQLGEAIDVREYLERFPDQRPQLKALLGQVHTVTVSAHPSSDRSSPQPGQQLDDFELLAQLGSGAFATVFLARQLSMHRLVALKVSRSRAAESETLAQLDHPCIVRVYDQKQLCEPGLHLMYMQYVPGGTLQAVIERLKQTPAEQRTGRVLLRVIDASLEQRGESPPAESPLRHRLAGMKWPEVVCWLGARLAEALDHAHAQKVLHRDVKPANVLLSAEGLPRLADFNVGCCSKVEGAGPAAFFGGSLAYMSPEQLEAFNPTRERAIESLDGRSDLYSLGVLLWELLTGELPFADLSVPANWSVLLDHMLEQRIAFRGKFAAELGKEEPVFSGPPPPASFQIPGLKDSLLTCLAADPDWRYQSGRELAAQLDLCLKPRARKLLYPPAHGWQHWVQHFPIVVILLVGLVANGLMGVFNFVYNEGEIIAKGHLRKEVFIRTQAVINGVAFPLGIALFLRIAWPLHRGLKRLRQARAAAQRLSPGHLAELRQLCLRLGKYGADICLTCWLLAGFVYPITLAAGGAFGETGTGPALSFQDSIWVFVHFFASLFMCGLVAAAYPFFTSTFLAIRAIYPMLLQPGAGSAGDVQALRQVTRFLAGYLGVAASVPLLALTVLSFFGEAGSRILNGILGLGGLIGFVGMFALSGVIRADLEALIEVVQPGK